jgi:hypothetical protein
MNQSKLKLEGNIIGYMCESSLNDNLNVLNINIDPFNACNIRFKAPEISPEIEIFINKLFKNDKFFPAVSMIVGGILHIIEAELKVIDGKVWKKIPDRILKKVCLDLYDFQRDTTCWYNITMLRTLLNQYGVTKQMLWDYAWVKSSRVREAYKRAGILIKI